ncbi:hypothetical protein HDU96_010498 [Phlyctochytrium bullatum]|nr:hypothetical protein HDU96_010498 [Phlyctochytrium bullatum]
MVGGKELKHRRSQDLLRSFISPGASPLRLLGAGAGGKKEAARAATVAAAEMSAMALVGAEKEKVGVGGRGDESCDSTCFEMFLAGTLAVQTTADASSPEGSGGGRSVGVESLTRGSEEGGGWGGVGVWAEGEAGLGKEATMPRPRSEAWGNETRKSPLVMPGSVAAGGGGGGGGGVERPRFHFFGRKKQVEEENVHGSAIGLHRGRGEERKPKPGGGGTPEQGLLAVSPSLGSAMPRRASEPQLGSPSAMEGVGPEPPGAVKRAASPAPRIGGVPVLMVETGAAGQVVAGEGSSPRVSPTGPGLDRSRGGGGGVGDANLHEIAPWAGHSPLTSQQGSEASVEVAGGAAAGAGSNKPVIGAAVVGAIVGTVTGATHAMGEAVSGAAGTLAEAASNVKRRLKKDFHLDIQQLGGAPAAAPPGRAAFLEGVLSEPDLVAAMRRYEAAEGIPGDEGGGTGMERGGEKRRPRLMKDVFRRQARGERERVRDRERDQQRHSVAGVPYHPDEFGGYRSPDGEPVSPTRVGGMVGAEEERPESRGARRARKRAERLKVRRSFDGAPGAGTVLSNGEASGSGQAGGSEPDDMKLESAMITEIGAQRRERLFKRRRRRSASLKRPPLPKESRGRKSRNKPPSMESPEDPNGLPPRPSSASSNKKGLRRKERGSPIKSRADYELPSAAVLITTNSVGEMRYSSSLDGNTSPTLEPNDGSVGMFMETPEPRAVDAGVQADLDAREELDLEKALVLLGKKLFHQIQGLTDKAPQLRKTVQTELARCEEIASKYAVPVDLLDTSYTTFRVLELHCLELDLPDLPSPPPLPKDHLLTPALVKHTEAIDELTRALNTYSTRIGTLIASIEADERTVKTMVTELDDLADQVNETWSRKLKVVEDKVQVEENSRMVAMGFGKELWYQFLAYLLTGAAFLIWLSYQVVKVGKLASSHVRGYVEWLLDPAASCASAESSSGAAAKSAALQSPESATAHGSATLAVEGSGGEEGFAASRGAPVFPGSFPEEVS